MTGPPLAICSRNKGTTEPDEPSTLPKRTMVKRVAEFSSAKPCKTNSASRLLAPIVLVGRTALSVEINTKVSTWLAIAALAQLKVPNTLLRMPSVVFFSTIGTCLYAAA